MVGFLYLACVPIILFCGFWWVAVVAEKITNPSFPIALGISLFMTVAITTVPSILISSAYLIYLAIKEFAK